MCGCTSKIPQPSSAIWNHCQFLQRQGIFFYRCLGFFVCTTHGFLVHPYHLQAHLKSHDLSTAVGKKSLAPGGWANLLNHVQRSFNVWVKGGASEPILSPKWSMVSTPVPSIPVVFGFKCILCNLLLGTGDSMEEHLYHEHQSQPTHPTMAVTASSNSPTSFTRVYVQELFPHKTLHPPLFPKEGRKSYFLVPNIPENNFSYHQPSLQAVPLLGTFPPYIVDLGWTEWLESTCLSPAFLKWLVSPPTYQGSSSECHILEKVECGLQKTSKLLEGYLCAADDELSSLTPGIRSVICGL